MTLHLFGRPSLFSLCSALSFFWIFYTFFFLHPSLTCPSPSTHPLTLVLCERRTSPSFHQHIPIYFHFLPASSSVDEPHLPLSIRSQLCFDPRILLSRYLLSRALFQFSVPLNHSHKLGKLMKSIFNKLFIGPMSLSEYCFISLLPDDMGTAFKCLYPVSPL